jgi:hypothetical protein
MSEYAGRIAIGVSLVLVVSVVFAFELNYFLPANVATSSTQSTSIGTSPVPSGTSWFGDNLPPGGCGNTTVIGTALTEGYRLEVHSLPQVVAQTSATQGNAVCIYTSLQNLRNVSTSLPVNESLAVTNAETPGVVYFQGLCQAPAYSGSFGQNGTSWDCAFYWNTSNAYNYTGLMDYQIVLAARFSNSPTVVLGGGNIHVEGGSGSNSSTTTTTSSTTLSKYYCGGPTFQLESPTQNSSVFLRIVTDQGSVIPANNGTVFLAHTAPAATGNSSGTWDYCLRLAGNSTGYMPLVGNGSYPAAGSYNVTLFAGYGEGPGYQGSIPTVTVEPNSTVYVTISVPSGDVTIVECPQTGSCSTTTSMATTLSGG